jgi:hypothetical protein
MADAINTNDAQDYGQPPEPSPDLKALNRLVGTWEHSGAVRGTTTYEWMEGGFFLIQRVDLEQYGQSIKGIEIIGHLRPFGQVRPLIAVPWWGWLGGLCGPADVTTVFTASRPSEWRRTWASPSPASRLSRCSSTTGALCACRRSPSPV